MKLDLQEHSSIKQQQTHIQTTTNTHICSFLIDKQQTNNMSYMEAVATLNNLIKEYKQKNLPPSRIQEGSCQYFFIHQAKTIIDTLENLNKDIREVLIPIPEYKDE